MDKETAERLRKEHPNFMSPKDAAPFLGMSVRKLSELVAEGRAQYEHVYLTTRSRIGKSFLYIMKEEDRIEEMRKEEGRRAYALDGADIELWPRRLYFNTATDLLKYIRFFAAVTDDIRLRQTNEHYHGEIQYELYARVEDGAIAHIYPDVNEADGVVFHVY